MFNIALINECEKSLSILNRLLYLDCNIALYLQFKNVFLNMLCLIHKRDQQTEIENNNPRNVMKLSVLQFKNLQ